MFFKKKKQNTEQTNNEELFIKLTELKQKYEALIKQLKDKNRAADELLKKLKMLTNEDDGK